MLPGGPLASTIRRRYSGATTGGTGPILATLVPPADDPLAGPSLKSQTLPPDSTANPHRPATACACASVGEFSIRQKSGPSGNCNTFFSVSTLVTRDPGGKPCCAATADDNMNAGNTSLVVVPGPALGQYLQTIAALGITPRSCSYR